MKGKVSFNEEMVEAIILPVSVGIALGLKSWLPGMPVRLEKEGIYGALLRVTI